ncbi:MAG: hypothetical protein SFV54_16065 [Bryobacteraceae bacterium]|nr:hypothetical protein [Bryobacteraceae bacterium]
MRTLERLAITALAFAASAAYGQNNQGGLLGIRPAQSPWVFAKSFQLNMGGAAPWGYVDVPGAPVQRIVIEQVSVAARTTAGATLRCAFDMDNQPGAQFLPFVYIKTSPANRLGTEVVASEKVTTFLLPGDVAHFRCHAHDGGVEGNVSVTLIGRYE